MPARKYPRKKLKQIKLDETLIKKVDKELQQIFSDQNKTMTWTKLMEHLLEEWIRDQEKNREFFRDIESANYDKIYE